MVSADDKIVIGLRLSSGREDDSPNGKELIKDKGAVGIKIPLVMDRAYESEEKRSLCRELNYDPIVPPKSNSKVNPDMNMTSKYTKIEIR